MIFNICIGGTSGGGGGGDTPTPPSPTDPIEKTFKYPLSGSWQSEILGNEIVLKIEGTQEYNPTRNASTIVFKLKCKHNAGYSFEAIDPACWVNSCTITFNGRTLFDYYSHRPEVQAGSTDPLYYIPLDLNAKNWVSMKETTWGRGLSSYINGQYVLFRSNSDPNDPDKEFTALVAHNSNGKATISMRVYLSASLCTFGVPHGELINFGLDETFTINLTSNLNNLEDEDELE